VANLGHHYDAEIDENVVDQLLSLRTVPSNTAERVEALRRWLRRGGSEYEFCNAHGWRHGRYTIRPDDDLATARRRRVLDEGMREVS
jgi:asparagine synthetase A